MTEEALLSMLEDIQQHKYETNTLELKAARGGCPKLFDTLSSFSNQSEGGIIIFGVDETKNFEECGVYDVKNIQTKINERCLDMEPVVRPLLSIAEKNGKYFVSAEIPGLDVINRPCFYKGKGMSQGSYVRIGDSDEKMTEDEIYNYVSFQKKYEDDVRILEKVPEQAVDPSLVEDYLRAFRREKPGVANLQDAEILDIMRIFDHTHPSIASLLLFGKYPQAYVPNLCVNACVVPGTEMGDVDDEERRFIDSERIEGRLPDMLDAAEAFVRRNEKINIIINDQGKRIDREEYPAKAIREAILNALEHRDYSVHAEGKPIQLIMYRDRVEIHSPGGLYGRMEVQDLGVKQPDSRNPHLVAMLELLGITENRYSGIPTIRKEMSALGLPEPVFEDRRGTFVVTLFNNDSRSFQEAMDDRAHESRISKASILTFCETPRTRAELNQFLGLSSTTYGFKRYIQPLIDSGELTLSIPSIPGSQKQTYTTRK